ncbi:MAG: CoA pyrophosphatase [Candidatus Caldarchaeum sp.]
MESRLKLLTEDIDEFVAGPSTAAVAIVIKPGPFILLVKRVVREDDPWSGQIAFPGGRWNHEDRSIVETALRELEEETGLSREAVEVLGQMRSITPANMPTLKVRPVLCKLLTETNLRPGPEVQNVFWLPLHGLRKKVVKVRTRHAPYQRLTLAYIYDGLVIWGMTARLVDRLIDVV